jgi:chromosomal replication initiator protein
MVARAFNLTVEHLMSRDRSQNVALPRQVAMYLMRDITNASLPQIGEVMGGRDHTTVMYAIEKIKNVDKQSDLGRKIKNITQQIYSQAGMAA